MENLLSVFSFIIMISFYVIKFLANILFCIPEYFNTTFDTFSDYKLICEFAARKHNFRIECCIRYSNQETFLEIWNVTFCDLQWPFRSNFIEWKFYVFIILAFIQNYDKIRFQTKRHTKQNGSLNIKVTLCDLQSLLRSYFIKFASL